MLLNLPKSLANALAALSDGMFTISPRKVLVRREKKIDSGQATCKLEQYKTSHIDQHGIFHESDASVSPITDLLAPVGSQLCSPAVTSHERIKRMCLKLEPAPCIPPRPSNPTLPFSTPSFSLCSHHGKRPVVCISVIWLDDVIHRPPG